MHKQRSDTRRAHRKEVENGRDGANGGTRPAQEDGNALPKWVCFCMTEVHPDNGGILTRVDCHPGRQDWWGSLEITEGELARAQEPKESQAGGCPEETGFVISVRVRGPHFEELSQDGDCDREARLGVRGLRTPYPFEYVLKPWPLGPIRCGEAG